MKLGLEDGQPDGIQNGDAQGRLTILGFLMGAGNDDSNTSDESFKHNKSYQKEFDDQLKEESQFMKTLLTKEQSTLQHKKQGNYILHEQQHNHFYKMGCNRCADNDDEEENRTEYQHRTMHKDDHDSIPSTGSMNDNDAASIGSAVEVPQNLQSGCQDWMGTIGYQHQYPCSLTVPVMRIGL